MPGNDLINKVKKSLRITTNDFDTEIADLIDAATLDLGIAGITNLSEVNHLIIRAVTTYVKCNFGDPDNYDRLKLSYDEQKAQLSIADGYTDYSMVT